MKKGRVLSLNKLNFSGKLDVVSTMFYILLIIFVVLGITTFSIESNCGNLISKTIDYYINFRLKTGFLGILLQSLLFFIFFDIITVSIGISLTGIIIIPVILAFLGYFFGCVLSYNFIKYSIKGIAFNAIVIIPVFLIFLIAFTYIVRYYFGFCLKLFKITVANNKNHNISEEFSLLVKKFLFLLFVSVILAVIDSILGFYVIKIFGF
ncbi:MAG: hypothetical protein MJ090_02100 [Clostridia bacterium]|nr:hypothetical protein [Clostridia bacterium]